MKDIYFDLISQYSEEIVELYQLLKEKHPIMEYDVQEKKIHAYYPDEYLANLSIKNQHISKEQYTKAIKNNELVVYVSDSKNRKLFSYCMAIN